MPHPARRQFDYPNQIVAANDNYVVGTTTLNGAMLAALDSEGNDSGNLHLKTSQLIVKDIQDSATSKNVSVGISADINNPFKRNESNKGNTPTLDASYSSSDFKQTTKGTIGNGTIEVANAESSTPLSAINRDIKTTQTVTKDKQSGFTLYVDEAATKELAAIIKDVKNGDYKSDPENAKDHSIIIQGAASLSNDPLIIIKSAQNEIDALFDKTGVSDSQIKELFKTIAIQTGIKGSEQTISANYDKAIKLVQPQLDALEKLQETYNKQADEAEASGDIEQATSLRKKAEAAETGQKYIKQTAALSASIQYATYKDPAGVLSKKLVTIVGVDGMSIYNDQLGLINGGAYNVDGKDVIVVIGHSSDSGTVGRYVINTLKAGQELQKEYGEIWTIAVTGVQTVATGGIKPILAYATGKAIEKGIEAAPKEILEPLVAGAQSVGKYVGDNTASFILNKDYDIFATAQDGSRPATDSSAATWGAETIVGISATAIGGKIVSTYVKKAGKEIKNVKSITAEEANAPFRENGWEDPHSNVSLVRVFETSSDIKFVRVLAEGSNTEGAFLVRANEIAGMTPEQIQQHLALPQVPTKIVDVIVPAGTKMQVSRVAPQPKFGAPNIGGVQYQLLQRIPQSSYGKPRTLK